MVRRILATHYKPVKNKSGPSWLTFLGHAKDSLWSKDLFKTESIVLKTHRVLAVMDQHTRAIVGFAIQPIAVDGAAQCRKSNYNKNRTHQGLLRKIPDGIIKPATFERCAWKPLCNGLFHMPVAA